MSINTVTLSGRLVAAPELRYTSTGVAVANGRVAVDHGFGDSKTTFFFEYSTWNSTAEYMAKYATKGMPVTLHGKLVQKTWHTPEGEFRSKVEVRVIDVVLPPKPIRDCAEESEDYRMYGEGDGIRAKNHQMIR